MEHNDYVITGAGMQLTRLVAQALEREFHMEKGQIGMGVPGEDHNLAVCIYLYDIRKNPDIHLPQMIPVSATQLKYPSNYYNLYFMLVPYSYSDRKYRMEEELKLMDVLLQVLGDIHHLEKTGGGETEVDLEIYDMDLDAKAKIWTGLNKPMRMAVYCKAGPVEIQSARTKQVKRVTDIRMDFSQVEGQGNN
ncbi:MAG: DUF4255 domain-containing protein [Lachnospiraceae bacterium]|nr:DUF4255 domain-containing protein [Lachnospiraceae bacterium]